MDKEKLSSVIRAKASRIYEEEVARLGNIGAETADTSELLKVLSRVLEGKSVEEAFGAPGRWGYGTPIGDAIAARNPSQGIRG